MHEENKLTTSSRSVRRFGTTKAPTRAQLAELTTELNASRRVFGFISEHWGPGWWGRDGEMLLGSQDNRVIRLIPLLINGTLAEQLPNSFSDRPGIKILVAEDGSIDANLVRAVMAVVAADHETDESTVMRLHRWFDGDDSALEELLSDNLPWMQAFVRKHLNARLRRRFDSMDVVQDGAMRILRYNPRHPPASKAQMRALFKKALLDSLRDKIDHLTANRRDIDREESYLSPRGSTDRPLGPSSEDRPDQIAEKSEQREWVKLALQQLDPIDRSIILRREYHKESFDSIAVALELASADATRMRYNRALPKLASKIRELRRVRQEQSGGAPFGAPGAGTVVEGLDA